MSSAIYQTHPHLAPEVKKIETAAHRAVALEVIDALLVVKLEKSQRGRNITRADIIELRARYAEPEESRHSVEISADMMDAPLVHVEYIPEPEEEKKG